MKICTPLYYFTLILRNPGKGNCVLKPKVRVIYGIVIYEGYLSKEILSGFKCLGA